MEYELKRCPYCRETIAMDLLDGGRIEKTAFKANKQAIENGAKQNRGKNGVADRLGAQRAADALHDTTNFNRSLAFVQSLTEKNKHRSIAWMIIHNDIPQDYKELFDLAQYSLGTRFSFDPVNYTGTAKSHVLNAVWYWAFRDAYLRRKKMRSGKNASMPQLQVIRNRIDGMDRMELRFRDKELKSDKYILALALTPVCPYCKRLLPNVFLDITDDPLSINLIGDPKVGKTVWQTALLYYLYKNRNVPVNNDCWLSIPEPLDAELAERIDKFSKGIIPNQTAREAIDEQNLRKSSFSVGNRSQQPMSPVDVFNAAMTPAPATPDVFSFTQTGTAAGSGTLDTRPIPFLFVLHKKINGKVRRRFVNICDFPGENLAMHIEGVNNTDLYRTADALFLFADVCTSETGLASVNSFIENSLSHGLPHLALIIPKADKEAFLQRLTQSFEKDFSDTFTRIMRFHLTTPTATVQTNALSQLCNRLVAEYLHCSPEEIAGYVINRFSDLLFRSSIVRYSVEPEETQTNVTLQDVITAVCEDEEMRKRFVPSEGSFRLAAIAENRLFTHNERPAQSTGCEVQFDEQANMLRQYYLRHIFPDDSINLSACIRHARDLSVFPVSALGMEAFEENSVLRFFAEGWDPVNLTEPLYWFLNKIYE